MGGGGGRKQAALWPEWSVTQWLSRRVAKSLLRSAVMCSCHVRAEGGGGGDGRDGVVVLRLAPVAGRGTVPTVSGSGGPARTSRLDWTGRAGLA